MKIKMTNDNREKVRKSKKAMKAFLEEIRSWGVNIDNIINNLTEEQINWIKDVEINEDKLIEIIADNKEKYEQMADKRAVEEYILRTLLNAQYDIAIVNMLNKMGYEARRSGDDTDGFKNDCNVSSMQDIITKINEKEVAIEVQSTFLTAEDNVIKIKYSKYKKSLEDKNSYMLLILHEYDNVEEIKIGFLDLKQITHNNSCEYSDNIFQAKEGYKVKGYRCVIDKSKMITIGEFLQVDLEELIKMDIAKVNSLNIKKSA